MSKDWNSDGTNGCLLVLLLVALALGILLMWR